MSSIKVCFRGGPLDGQVKQYEYDVTEIIQPRAATDDIFELHIYKVGDPNFWNEAEAPRVAMEIGWSLGREYGRIFGPGRCDLEAVTAEEDKTVLLYFRDKILNEMKLLGISYNSDDEFCLGGETISIY